MAALWRENGEQVLRADPFQCGSVSGCGSSLNNTREFVDWLPTWLTRHGIESLVDASSGHWPTGWQQEVRWPSPPLSYLGVDVVQAMVEDSQDLVRQVGGAGHFGLRSMEFRVQDMLQEALPEADLLLTKDTLMHWPNDELWRFLNLTVLTCPPRYRYVMSVTCSNEMAEFEVDNLDIGVDSYQYRPVNLATKPFLLPAKVAFSWMGLTDIPTTKRKVVQVYEPRRC